MRILLVHNYYQQSGGEDKVYSSEVALLREYGNTVIEYIEDNKRINRMSSATVAIQTIWSQQSYRRLFSTLKSCLPEIAHFHNTFPLISPSVYYACQKLNIPVIQSLDNPRLFCPAATCYRNDGPCLDCLGKTPPWPGIVHRCYHNSVLHSSVVSTMLTFHRLLKTWEKQINLFLVATTFFKKLFLSSGIPEKKLVIKPHFVPHAGKDKAQRVLGYYVLYLGRLDPEKGIRVLLLAWKMVNIPLKIRGSGQLEKETRKFIQEHNLSNIELVGKLSEEDLFELILNARFLIWPSNGYYETFGLAAVECFATGIPVIASRIGVMQELVTDGETGLLFNPGDAVDLAAKVEWMWNHPEESERMGRQARHEYEQKYTPERNYELLMEIYRRALNNKP
jgi:glycosyltransferase involved in cell wall biosynthesis